MTTEDFIARAKQIHGDTYDYSKVKYKNSVSKVEIICREHGSFFQNAGNHINPKIRCGCPHCAEKKVMSGVNDFATLYPKAASEWDYSKNIVLPSEVLPRTNKKYYFLCSKGHSYLQSLNNKTSKNYGCPYCSGQALLKGYNDLQTVYPEIAKEWDYSRNENGPSDYRSGSGYKAWWVCNKCGQSYQSPINAHIRGHKCAYCSGQKVVTGKTDLKTLYPEIASEYSDKNSVPVNQISAHFAWCAAYTAVRAGEAKSLICVVFSPSKGLDLCRFDPHKGLDLCETQGKYKESRIDYKKCCIDAAYKLFAI